ncbi:F-box protein At1g52495-like [Bidens hawaiensis]|uniref:F-box protein At1g52495-like n=1 Tax=Bidens hawaiensis TaxID=980011 RepID=UPI004049FBBF
MESEASSLSCSEESKHIEIVPAVHNNRRIWHKYVKLSPLKRLFQNKWAIVRRGVSEANRSTVIRYLRKSRQVPPVQASYIPFAIKAEIMRWLPTKSLLRFRSVSKEWKSLIDSSKFVFYYSINRARQHRLLVCHPAPENLETKYVCIVDDELEPFPQHLTTTTLVPGGLISPNIIGSSQGLFWVYGYAICKSGIYMKVIVWNPSIRKSVAIDVLHRECYETRFGFGVFHRSSDPMLVKVSYRLFTNLGDIMSCTPWEVEVYALSLRAWRSIPTINQPRNSILLGWRHVGIDEIIYWFAVDCANVNMVENIGHNLIVSFDMASERFIEISLPADNLTRAKSHNVAISKLKESLIIVEEDQVKRVYNVWMMMEHRVPKSLTKILTVNKPDTSIRALLGFRKNDEPCDPLPTEPIFETSTHINNMHDVAIDELHSEHMSYIGISGPQMNYYACSYMETLLLLDH